VVWQIEIHTIAERQTLVERAFSSSRFGPYTLQATIAAVHAEASDAAATDWAQIVVLYSLLARVEQSPVVELNRVKLRHSRQPGSVVAHATDNGARVINLSLGGSSCTTTTRLLSGCGA
jgi:predicted RNA polymerase sigma factor